VPRYSAATTEITGRDGEMQLPGTKWRYVVAPAAVHVNRHDHAAGVYFMLTLAA
jgi:hypothetical protein